MSGNKKTCPKCGETYTGRPATSRFNGNMPICPKCGTREALEVFGAPKDQIEEIIVYIYGKPDNK